jgi:alpha-glucosidase
MLLGLRGTPFLYAGEELGLEDAVIPPARVVDPGGRDGCRAPIPWEPALPHGWATPNPWLPWPPGQDAATQEDDPRSFLRLYRDALAVRAASPALARGDFAWIPSATDVLAWRRTSGDDEVVVAINFSDDASPLDTLPGAWRVESATDPELVGGTFSKALNGSSAVWLRRA